MYITCHHVFIILLIITCQHVTWSFCLLNISPKCVWLHNTFAESNFHPLTFFSSFFPQTKKTEQTLFLSSLLSVKTSLLRTSTSTSHTERDREKMVPKYFQREVLPVTALVIMECANVGLNTLFKAATLKGMSFHVFIVYSYGLAALLLLPSLFCSFRSLLDQFETKVFIFSWNWVMGSC